MWRHWFQLTSVQAVKYVSNGSFLFASPQAVLTHWCTCMPFAQFVHINLRLGVAHRAGEGTGTKQLTPMVETVCWMAECPEAPGYRGMQKTEKLK
jgi:hypothetical protein